MQDDVESEETMVAGFHRLATVPVPVDSVKVGSNRER